MFPVINLSFFQVFPGTNHSILSLFYVFLGSNGSIYLLILDVPDRKLFHFSPCFRCSGVQTVPFLSLFTVFLCLNCSISILISGVSMFKPFHFYPYFRCSRVQTVPFLSCVSSSKSPLYHSPMQVKKRNIFLKINFVYCSKIDTCGRTSSCSENA